MRLSRRAPAWPVLWRRARARGAGDPARNPRSDSAARRACGAAADASRYYACRFRREHRRTRAPRELPRRCAGLAGSPDTQPERREPGEREQAARRADARSCPNRRSAARGRAVIEQQRFDRQDRAPRQREGDQAAAALSHPRAIATPPWVGARPISAVPSHTRARPRGRSPLQEDQPSSEARSRPSRTGRSAASRRARPRRRRTASACRSRGSPEAGPARSG